MGPFAPMLPWPYGGPPTGVPGPYCVHIGQVYQAGAAPNSGPQPGADVGEVFVPGIHVGQLQCEMDGDDE